MLKIIPNKKNIGAEIIVNLKDITNKDILKISLLEISFKLTIISAPIFFLFGIIFNIF